MLIDLLIKDQIANIEIPEGPKGSRGLKGKDGNDFNLEDHKEQIIQLIQDNSNVTLTVEQLEALQGKDGIDGKDGTSVYAEEVIPELTKELHAKINEIKDDLKLKFSDLSEEEIVSLTGPRGAKGRDGIDFSFEDHSDKIKNSLSNLLNEIKEDLKLKFSDLTEEERLQLRGGRGQKGSPGKDFDYEENRNKIEDSLKEINKQFLPELKLKFSDLSEAEVDSLKLKFSQLTEEEKQLLKGSRGQRGKPGVDGENGLSAFELSEFEGTKEDWIKSLRGEQGPRGITGVPGISGRDGKNGKDGQDGEDGKDAPRIIDVELDSNKETFSLTLSLDDGTELTSNKVKFPATKIENFYSGGGVYGGGGGGSGTANPTEYFDEGVSIGTAEKLNFIGANVSTVMNGDTVDVTITGGSGTGTTDLKVYEGNSLIVTTDELEFDTDDFEVTDNAGRAVISLKPITAVAEIGIYDEYNLVTATTKNINFIGEYVTVRQRVPMSEWDLLNNVTPDMASYLGDGLSDTVDVFIDLPDSSLLKDVACLSSVYVGAFVIINSSEIAENALADQYSNSNVIGLVESKSSATICDIRVSGISSAIFSSLDTSLDYYLSDSVPGGLSATVPTTSGHIKLKLGQAFGTTKFLFSKGERVVRL